MDDLYTLAIVGAGLSALSALRAGLSSERTIVLDYQEQAGGFLRPALPAPGFEDFSALLRENTLSGRLTARFNATVVGLMPAFEEGGVHTLIVRQRSGTAEIRAQRVLIACGGLELTREHAQIPGTRPAGVVTPTLVHQFLQRGYAPGKQIVVYGSSHYALVTATRLVEAGLAVTLVNSENAAGAVLSETSSSRLAILPPAQLVALDGFPRLERLSFKRADDLFTLSADTLVYGAGMQANTHWLKGSGLALNAHGAIQVDRRYQTNLPGVYAIGTAVSPSLDHADSLAMGKEVASLLSGGSL